MLIRLIVFLIINFGALGIAGSFTSKGVPSIWYQGLNKAPWTPPGWVFGAAWTFIMLCFTVYMAYAWEKIEDKKILVTLFVAQWILNVLWSPVFFHFKETILGLVVISLLTIVVGMFLIGYWNKMRIKSLLVLPYFMWLLIATSLNGYVVFCN